MGVIWDLIQQVQLGDAAARSESLEERVMRLEHQLQRTNDVLSDLLRLLERRFGEDLDGDGRIG